MFYKYSNIKRIPFHVVDLAKRKISVIAELKLLYPLSRVVDEAKHKDLQSLLPYVPPVHHMFYKEIKTSATVQDVGLVVEHSDEN